MKQFELQLEDQLSAPPLPRKSSSALDFEKTLSTFNEFGTPTQTELVSYTTIGGVAGSTTAYINEFWTASQRAADNLHEVSYRACFKPQLPRFFIEHLTSPGERVYDPFMGRGTTLLEAALLGRQPAGNDINPLSLALIRPRLGPPLLSEVRARLDSIPWNDAVETWDDLLVFYHADTLRELTNLKNWFLQKQKATGLDIVDEWIRMVAINRLTGHSKGFFSVYTLPPNQAVSIKSQERINQKRNQTPDYRNVKALIAKKSKNLLSDISEERHSALCALGKRAILSNSAANNTPLIPSGSVSLVVTSPPFLDVVQYAIDNWLRCWFIGVDAEGVKLTVPGKLDRWRDEMTAVFFELARVLKPEGHVAFEVGEVRNGKVKLEETVLACGVESGLEPILVLINDQEFTKTANCWGVDNNARGTNTNRIVLFRKP
ncbi:MAG: DNA methyltransferase [Verrucomicrobiota bacterium]